MSRKLHPLDVENLVLLNVSHDPRLVYPSEIRYGQEWYVRPAQILSGYRDLGVAAFVVPEHLVSVCDHIGLPFLVDSSVRPHADTWPAWKRNLVFDVNAAKGMRSLGVAVEVHLAEQRFQNETNQQIDHLRRMVEQAKMYGTVVLAKMHVVEFTSNAEFVYRSDPDAVQQAIAVANEVGAGYVQVDVDANSLRGLAEKSKARVLPRATHSLEMEPPTLIRRARENGAAGGIMEVDLTNDSSVIAAGSDVITLFDGKPHYEWGEQPISVPRTNRRTGTWEWFTAMPPPSRPTVSVERRPLSPALSRFYNHHASRFELADLTTAGDADVHLPSNVDGFIVRPEQVPAVRMEAASHGLALVLDMPLGSGTVLSARDTVDTAVKNGVVAINVKVDVSDFDSDGLRHLTFECDRLDAPIAVMATFPIPHNLDRLRRVLRSATDAGVDVVRLQGQPVRGLAELIQDIVPVPVAIDARGSSKRQMLAHTRAAGAAGAMGLIVDGNHLRQLGETGRRELERLFFGGTPNVRPYDVIDPMKREARAQLSGGLRMNDSGALLQAGRERGVLGAWSEQPRRHDLARD